MGVKLEFVINANISNSHHTSSYITYILITILINNDKHVNKGKESGLINVIIWGKVRKSDRKNYLNDKNENNSRKWGAYMTGFML